MNPICVICSDYLQSSQVYSIQCGHLYHSSCIKDWCKVSSTCPQCRCICKIKRRIYLNFPSYDSALEENNILHNKIKTLEEQLNMKNNRIYQQLVYFKNTTKKLLGINRTLEKQLSKVSKDEKSNNAPVANSSGMHLRSGKIINNSK